MIFHRCKHSNMTEHKPITNIKLTPYLVAIRRIKRELFSIDTVFYDFKIAVTEEKMPRRIGARQSDIRELIHSLFIESMKSPCKPVEIRVGTVAVCDAPHTDFSCSFERLDAAARIEMDMSHLYLRMIAQNIFDIALIFRRCGTPARYPEYATSFRNKIIFKRDLVLCCYNQIYGR